MSIKAIVFDAYGTLYDVQSVAETTEQAFPGYGGIITQLWRIKQLEYSWLRSLMQRYQDFSVVTRDSLIYSLRAREFDRLAEFLDLLIDERKHFVEEPLLNGVVACECAEPLQCRCQQGRGFFKIDLKIRQQGRKIAALGAFGALQLQLAERYLVFDFHGVQHPAGVVARLVDQVNRAGADYRQHHEARRKQQDLPNRAPARDIRRHNSLAS